MKRETAATVAISLGVGVAIGTHGADRPADPMAMPPYPVVWHMSKTEAVPIRGAAGRCVLRYGAPILLTRQGIIHTGQAAHESECREGTLLGMSVAAARKEEQAYRQLEARKQAIIEAVRIGTHEEPAMVVNEAVAIANPYPVTKIYADRSREQWYYGQTCGAYGVAIRAGVLASGEVVWQLQSPLDGPYRPDGCPPGTKFVHEEVFVGIN